MRCTLCGFVFPGGWLPIPNRPESAMLLHHLAADHLVEVKPYLARGYQGEGRGEIVVPGEPAGLNLRSSVIGRGSLSSPGR
jgi:hypothetical protein